MDRYEKFLHKVVDTSDIERLMNVGDRQARRIMGRIRASVNKKPHQQVFLQEVLNYTGLHLQYAIGKLGWDKSGNGGADGKLAA